MKKGLTILLLFLSTICCFIQAHEINEQEAQKAAIRFFSRNNRLRQLAGKPTVIPTLSYTLQESGKNSIYIYNNSSDQGFVLIAGDDQAPQIIGYSDEGNFQYDQLPANAKAFVNHLSAQIGAISNGQEAASTALWDTEVQPLLKCKWGQEELFNSQCPLYQDQRCMTGCVATAMAQVMYKHQWPATGNGEINYKTMSLGIHLSKDLSQSTYLWPQMLPAYTNESNAESIEQVAQLMADCGYSVQMDYTLRASGASGYEMVRALVENFNYDKGTHLLTEDYYTAEEWRELVKAELDAGRPLLYGGSTISNEGHQFVCDGYNKDGLFHINWGWTGTSDGYFLLTLLNPADQGTGGSSTNQAFNLYVDAVFGMQPPVENSVAKPYKLYYTNLKAAVTGPKTVRLNALELVNLCYSTFFGDLRLELFDLASKDTVYSTKTKQPIIIQPVMQTKNQVFEFDASTLKPGAYGFRLVSIDAYNQEDILCGKPSKQSPYLVVTADGVDITYEEPTSIHQKAEVEHPTFFMDRSSKQIYLSDVNPIVTAEIYSLQGHLVQKSSHTSSVSLEGLQPGCYLLKWQTSKGGYTQKFCY